MSLVGGVAAHGNKDNGKVCMMALPCHRIRTGDGTGTIHLRPSSSYPEKLRRCSRGYCSNVSRRVPMLCTMAGTRAM
jgi:hypothetical protein